MKFLIIAIGLLTFSLRINAQSSISVNIANGEFQAKRVIPPSPEAAELGKYGNVPVSLFSGTPQINIPIFEAKVGGISLPISLSYNASGFKPEELASWVGLNWSLNAGGIITRSVIGNPDVVPYYFSSSNNYQDLFSQTDLIAKSDAMLDLKRGYKESQPDVYYYNFAGYSGKFIIKPDGTVIKKERDNLKIEHCITCFNPQVDGSASFTITDANGIVFEFKQTEVSVTQYDPGNIAFESGGIPGVLNYTYPSTWYLTKVTSANGNQSIVLNYYTTATEHTLFHNTLDYQSVSYYTSTEPRAVVTGTDPNIIYDGGPCQIYFCSNSNPGVNTLDQFNYGIAPTVTMKRKYVQSINVYSGTSLINRIDFESLENQRLDLDHNYYPGERILKSIKVYAVTLEASSTLVHQFDLQQSYFTGSQDLPDYKRLRLDQVKEVPVASNFSTAPKPPYIFEYNNGLNGLTPPVFTAGKDHWGFYNGQQNSYGGVGPTLIPTVSPGRGLGAVRDPSFEGSATNMLTKLTYPTGGFSTFEFELNDAFFDGNLSPVGIGGLRVKKIVDYSFTDKKATQKEYTYLKDDGTSSGSANYPIYTSTSSYVHSFQPALPSCNPNSCTQASDWVRNYYTVSASPITGLGYMQGSHIQYSQIIERQTDVNTGVPLGKTVFQYYVSIPTGNDDDIAAGDLLEKAEYDNNSKMLRDIKNTYNYLPYNSWIAATVKPGLTQSNKTILCQYNNGGQLNYKYYGIWESFNDCIQQRILNSRLDLFGYFFIGREKQLAQQTEKVFDQLSNNYLTITRKYTYGNPQHIFPTLIEESTSGNEIVGTIKKYVADYVIPSGITTDDPTKGLKLLKDKNILGAEVEKIQYRQNQDGTNIRYINGLINTYNPYSPFPSKVYRVETGIPLTSIQGSNINTGIFIMDPSYKSLGYFNYDINGNLQEQGKTLGAPKIYIWDAIYQIAVAEITNADIFSVAYTSFETYNSNGNWLIANLSPTLYINGGVTGSKSFNLNNATNFFKKDLNTTRKYIVSYWSQNGPATVNANAGLSTAIQGSTHGSWTYYEHKLPTGSGSVTITGNGIIIDELRLFPVDAQMTTNTFAPLLGITSQCGVNDQIVYYEYDGYNRLVNVRDCDNNIIKNFRYNFGLGASIASSPTSIFYNGTLQASFSKNGCPIGSVPTSVVYTVPYGKYVSSIDQATADGKAQAEITANGQSNANTYGQCLFYNASTSGFAFKNDCLPSQGNGSRVVYTVPAGRYSSTIDQATVDAMAAADVTANKQTFANTYGTCSCAAEGQKYIGNNCTTGTRYNRSTTQLANGQWQCVYYYQFSDGTFSQDYTSISSSACPIQ